MILWKQNKNHVLGLKPRQKIGWGKCWGENNSMLFSSLLGCSVLLLCQSAWPKNRPMVHLLMDGLLQPWGCIGDKLALSQWSQRPAPCSSKPLSFCRSLPAHLGKRQEWRLCPSALLQTSWPMQTRIHLHTGHVYLFQGSTVKQKLNHFLSHS